jgi:hypothetical protein
MSFISFLSKDKIGNENKSKPFYANVSDSERKDWFSRTRPWHKVEPKIIDALITIYGDNSMFEVFVVTSMGNSLVKGYEELGLKGLDPNIACSAISGLLAKHGTKASSQVISAINSGNINNEKKLAKLLDGAMNMLESSIIIDPNQVISYVQLARLRASLNKVEEARDFARQGLAAIERIQESNVPFHKSNLPGIQNTAQYLDDTKNFLLGFVDNLS